MTQNYGSPSQYTGLGYPQPDVPPQYTYAPQAPQQEPMTLAGWVLSIVISGIPVVGLIFLLVWSFGSKTESTKRLWARASLIVWIAGIILTGIAWTSGIFTLRNLIG